MTEQNQTALNILRRKQFEAKIGLGRSTIYARINPKSASYDPDFPQPVALGSGKNPPVGWIESEVNSWLEAQIKSRQLAA